MVPPPEPPVTGDAHEYWAFISYSQRDSKWARWLHRRLEGYRIPRRLARELLPDRVLPRRLVPVFLDREEFGPGGELGEQIERALTASRALIVVASPHAAASHWVNEEVRRFRASGRDERMFCLIADGEPNVSSGVEPADRECFPAAVRFRVDASGRITEEPSESLAADARPGKDGPRIALLKLIAGVLGVGFDALRQRDHERRVRFLTISGVVLAALVALFAGLAYYAIEQRIQAEWQRDVAFARQLAAQGTAVYEEEPLLGLRLALEAHAVVPEDADGVRVEIAETVHALARAGRLAKVGGDVQRVFLSPDDSVFVVDHAGAPAHLCRGSDGSVVATLTEAVNRVHFNPIPPTRYFAVDYGETMSSRSKRPLPGELRRANDGGLVAVLDHKVGRTAFGPLARLVAIEGQASTSQLLYRTRDGASLAPRSKEIVFRPDGARILVLPLYAAPELRAADGEEVLATLEDDVRGAEFSPDPAATWVVLQHQAPRPVPPGPRRRRPPPSSQELAELRSISLCRAADGAALDLGGAAKRVEFSPGDAARFVVRYAVSPPELRRTRDGSLLVGLPERLRDVTYSPDAACARVVLEYTRAPTELRDTDTGELVAVLGDEAFVVSFSPDGAYLMMQLRSTTPAPALRRSEDGSVVLTLPGEIENVVFDGGEAASRVLVDSFESPTTLYSLETGEGIDELGGEISRARFSPNARLFMVAYEASGLDPELRLAATGAVVPLPGMTTVLFGADKSVPYLIVGYDGYLDRPDELRSAVDGSLLATLSGTVDPDYTERSYTAPRFVIAYEDGRSELWECGADVRRIAELGVGVGGHELDAEESRLFVWYTDGRAYVLDLDWLTALGGNARARSVTDLARLVRDGVLDASPTTEAALRERYLGEREPWLAPR